MRALLLNALILILAAACASPGSRASPIVTSSAPTLTIQSTSALEPSSVAVGSFGAEITRELPPGDPERGEILFGPQGEFCSGCHSQLLVGPPVAAYDGHPAIAERAAATIEDPAYTGRATTVTEYLVESIVDPDAYVLPGFPDGNMPGNFGLLLSGQDISDLVAYMLVVE